MSKLQGPAGLGPAGPFDPISIVATGGTMVEGGLKHWLNDQVPSLGDQVEAMAKGAAADTLYGTPSLLPDLVKQIVSPPVDLPLCSTCAPYQEPGSTATVLDVPLNPFPGSGMTPSEIDDADAQQMLSMAKQTHDTLVLQEQQLSAQSAEYDQLNQAALVQSRQALQQGETNAQNSFSSFVANGMANVNTGNLQPVDSMTASLFQSFGTLLGTFSQQQMLSAKGDNTRSRTSSNEMVAGCPSWFDAWQLGWFGSMCDTPTKPSSRSGHK